MNKILDNNKDAADYCLQKLADYKAPVPKPDYSGTLREPSDYDPTLVANQILRASKAYETLISSYDKTTGRLPKHRFSQEVVEVINIMNDIENLKTKEEHVKVQDLIFKMEHYLNQGTSIEDLYQENVILVEELANKLTVSKDMVKELSSSIQDVNKLTSSYESRIGELLCEIDNISSRLEVEVNKRSSLINEMKHLKYLQEGLSFQVLVFDYQIRVHKPVLKDKP